MRTAHLSGGVRALIAGGNGPFGEWVQPLARAAIGRECVKTLSGTVGAERRRLFGDVNAPEAPWSISVGLEPTSKASQLVGGAKADLLRPTAPSSSR